VILRQVAPDEAAGAAARALQTAVLRPDGPLPGDSEHAIGALTVAAIDGEVVVGAVTVDRARWPVPDLAVIPDPQWQLRSLAVAPAARGSGLGGQLVAAAVDLARDAGAASLWAQIRVAALPVYLRQGWVSVGSEWDKPGVGPHRYGWASLR